MIEIKLIIIIIIIIIINYKIYNNYYMKYNVKKI